MHVQQASAVNEQALSNPHTTIILVLVMLISPSFIYLSP
jgi:hypothetical protein